MKTILRPNRATNLTIAFVTLSIVCAGCGKKSDDVTPPPSTSSAKTTPATASSTTAAPAAPAIPAYYTPGQQLADFTTYILNCHNVFKKTINDQGGASASMDALPLLTGCILPPQYDALERTQVETQKGELPWNKWTGQRSRSGDEIRCATDFTFSGGDSRSGEKSGDRVTYNATLNLKTNTLVAEKKTFRASKLIYREVYEAVIRPDKTLWVQSFQINGDPDFLRSGSPRAIIAFYSINADKGEYTSVTGDAKAPALEFAYDTLASKTNFDIAATAARHLTALKTTSIKNGKYSVEK